MSVSLHELAQALGGEIAGGQVLAPGPSHSPRDRSLAVRPSDKAPLGFVVHGFAGEDWRVCRDYVVERLGLRCEETGMRVSASSPASQLTRIERAQALWHEARDPRGTVVETYLRSRALDLLDGAAVGALRFHPRCPWREDELGITIRVPAMLAAMRSLQTRQITAVHRTRLTEDGRKVDRRMMGVAAGTAIMLDGIENHSELVVGEGIETCLSAAHFGMRPVWALATAGAIAAFPTLRGVDKLTLLGERDNASEVAVTACHNRWHAAGCTVSIVMPKVGKDMNDAWRGRP